MDFKREFKELVAHRNVNWNIRGLLSSDNRIYPFGSDTKVLSTVFELFCRPVVREIAGRHDYRVEEAPQTIYPDFTLLKSANDMNKIAVDIKTTYRRGTKRNGVEKDFVYTLGSYSSFIRNNTKNILYPFDQYEKHWIIGFLYSRNPEAYDNARSFRLDERNEIIPPYSDVEYFVQEKYKIAGERAGSGNTTNLASFPTNSVQPLDNGEGPFADLGEEAFLNYWRNYGKTAREREYTNLAEFLEWRRI